MEDTQKLCKAAVNLVAVLDHLVQIQRLLGATGALLGEIKGYDHLEMTLFGGSRHETVANLTRLSKACYGLVPQVGGQGFQTLISHMALGLSNAGKTMVAMERLERCLDAKTSA